MQQNEERGSLPRFCIITGVPGPDIPESMYDVTKDELWRIVESINPKHDNFDRIAIEHLKMSKVLALFAYIYFLSIKKQHLVQETPWPRMGSTARWGKKLLAGVVSSSLVPTFCSAARVIDPIFWSQGVP